MFKRVCQYEKISNNFDSMKYVTRELGIAEEERKSQRRQRAARADGSWHEKKRSLSISRIDQCELVKFCSDVGYFGRKTAEPSRTVLTCRRSERF